MSSIFSSIENEKEWLNTTRPLSSKDLAGRVVLLDFWTFCCVNCLHVIPKLSKLEKMFGENLTVIGVHSGKFAHEKGKDPIRQAIIKYGIEHPVVNDAGYRIWNTFGVRAWPTMILITPQGTIHKVFAGEGDIDQIAKSIEYLIQKNEKKLVTSKLPVALEKDKEPETELKYPSKLAYVEAYQGSPALFVADSMHQQIKGIRLDGRVVVTIGSGVKGRDDGDFAQVQFNNPQGLLYQDGFLYVADTGNHLIRRIEIAKGVVTTIAGTGKRGGATLQPQSPALQTALASPWDLAWYPDDKTMVIANAGTHQLLSYSLRSQTLSILAGSGRESIDDGPLPNNSLSQPSGLSVHDGKLYFVDSETSSLRVLHDGLITTLIGTGLFDFGYTAGERGQGQLQHPLGIHADASGVYIADTYNHAIRRYDYATKRVEDYAGAGRSGTMLGTLENAQFAEPNDIIRVGDVWYVADTNNHRLLVINPEQQSVSQLPVMSDVAQVRMFEADLPNLSKKEALSVSVKKPVSIRMGLQEGWKMNNLAPSWFALFKQVGDKFELVKHYSPEELQDEHIQLPELALDQVYTVQGTLYYCEKEKTAPLCRFLSYQQQLTPQEDGGIHTIKIRLNE